METVIHAIQLGKLLHKPLATKTMFTHLCTQPSSTKMLLVHSANYMQSPQLYDTNEDASNAMVAGVPSTQGKLEWYTVHSK